MRQPPCSVLVIAVALVLTGCSEESQERATEQSTTATSPAASAGPSLTPAPPSTVPPGKPGTPRGGVVKGVLPTNASSVANAYAVTVYTQDTRLDASPNDAARRARGWMTPDLARSYATGLPGSGGEPWRQLAAAGGYTKVSATEVDARQENDLRVGRDVLVTVNRLRGNDQPLGAPDTVLVSMVLVRESPAAPWRVLKVDLS